MDQTTEIKPKTKFRIFIDNLVYIATAVILAVIVQQFIIRPFVVNGESMSPTLETGDYILIDEISYKIGEPERGDVVVFKAPPEPSKYFIKRIIGLPGDTVSISGKQITITNDEYPNGLKLSESFITHPSSDEIFIKVPENTYYVMGDNRSGSYDSRMWGTLPKENLKGRAFLRLLPIKDIDYLPGKVNYE